MSDNKNIEDWTKANRDLFDDKELPVGHRELFESRLDDMLAEKSSAEKSGQSSFTWMKVAAAFVVGIAITSAVFYFNSAEVDNTEYAKSESISEIEHQYAVKIKDALVPVRANKNYMSPEYRSFFKEMEKLDKQNEELKELLLQNRSDERILNSIVENYKMRLKLLEQLKVIMTNKNLNSMNDETNI